ncbi:hypothetical protein MSKU3_0918 [Komagataeibacter oboediens]|nr:hypothetical protein MSKU3_0918 [Komagataeibacter oboediens]
MQGSLKQTVWKTFTHHQDVFSEAFFRKFLKTFDVLYK